MTGSARSSALAHAPFFVQERLEEALERAAAATGPAVDLCLELDCEVPELLSGPGELLRDALCEQLVHRARSPSCTRMGVRVRCTEREPAERAHLLVEIDDEPVLDLEVSVLGAHPRAQPRELANRRAVVLREGCSSAMTGLLTRLGLLTVEIHEGGPPLSAAGADVAVVDLPHARSIEIGSESALRARWELGPLPLVVATDTPFEISPGSATTSISRPVRRSRLAAALKTVLAPTSEPTPPSASGPEVAGLRVLVVDDQPINRAVIVAKLRRLGVRALDTATHGLDAVEAARASVYDLVLMDLQMPVMDGLEASRIILAEARSHRVVALTASTFEHDRAECQRVGMRGLLAKPVSETDLAEQLTLTLQANARRVRRR